MTTEEQRRQSDNGLDRRRSVKRDETPNISTGYSPLNCTCGKVKLTSLRERESLTERETDRQTQTGRDRYRDKRETPLDTETGRGRLRNRYSDKRER